MSKSKAKAKKRRKERKELRYEATHNMSKVNEKEKTRVGMVF
jgi:hypothetical protein